MNEEDLYEGYTQVGTKSELKTALGNDAAIILTDDIDYNEALTIPVGVTLNLNGHNLYITGLTNNGVLEKNGGKLFARVNTSATLTAAPTTASGLNNLWAANEELLRTGTELDGIRLMGNLSTGSNNPYNTGSNDNIYTWLQTNLPNLWGAGGCSMRYRSSTAAVKYGIPQIPAGKTLDLNGTTLTLRATQPTLGDGDIVANGGTITLWYNGTTSSVGGQTLKNAVGIANERPGIVRAFNQTGSAVMYNNFPIPSGVRLSLANGATVSENHIITFMVANEADFTRTGYALAGKFKLENGLVLISDIDVGDKSVDYDWFEVSGGSITTTGTELNKHISASVDTVEEFTTALSNATKITLTADINYDAVLTISEHMEIYLNGHKLFVTGLTNDGVLVKGDGELWANASASDPLTAIPTSANVSNIWAANEELLDPATEFDGIRLTGNLGYSSAATPATDKATILQRMASANAFVSNAKLAYATVVIPLGKVFDLNGFTFNMSAAQTGIGDGTILANGGQINVFFYGVDNAVPSLANAIGLAAAEPSIVKCFYQTGNTLDYTGQAIPSGVALVLINDAAVSGYVVFEASNESDFLKSGANLASAFKLNNDIDLSQNIDIGAKDVDYNNFECFGGKLLTTGNQTNRKQVPPDISDTSKSLYVGESFTLTATSRNDYPITWESSDDEIATVENGFATTLSVGSVVIYAMCGEAKTACQVSVLAAEEKTIATADGAEDPAAAFYRTLHTIRENRYSSIYTVFTIANTGGVLDLSHRVTDEDATSYGWDADDKTLFLDDGGCYNLTFPTNVEAICIRDSGFVVVPYNAQSTDTLPVYGENSGIALVVTDDGVFTRALTWLQQDFHTVGRACIDYSAGGDIWSFDDDFELRGVHLTINSDTLLKARSMALMTRDGHTDAASIAGNGEVWIADSCNDLSLIGDGITVLKVVDNRSDLLSIINGKDYDGVVLNADITVNETDIRNKDKIIRSNGFTLTRNGVWVGYCDKITNRGGTKRNAALLREKRTLLNKVPDNLSYQSVTIFDAAHGYNIESAEMADAGVNKEVAIINSDNLNEKYIFAMPNDDIGNGDLVCWMGNHWLVTERDANTTVYTRAKLLQCNYLLKWVSDDNTICEQWCVVEDGTKYLTGEYEDRNFVVTRGDSRLAMTIARNSRTVKFGRNNRFIIDDDESPVKLAYALTKPFKPGWTYNNEGVYKFVLQEVNTTDDDNQQLGIADYYKHFPKTAEGNEQETATPSANTSGNTGKKVWL